MNQKLNKKLRARSKNKNLEELEEYFDKLGIDLNKDSLNARVKKSRGIAELEDN